MQAKQAEKVAEAQTKSKGLREAQDRGVGYAAYTIADQRELLQALYYEGHRPGAVRFAGAGPSAMGFRSADEKTDNLSRQILSFYSSYYHLPRMKQCLISTLYRHHL